MRIYLTGRVMIETSDRVLTASALPGRQGRLAFVYLVAQRRRVDRDQLAELLWPQGLPAAWESALHALISKLRASLRKAAADAPSIEAAHGAYELVLPEGTWVDLRVAVNELDRAEGALRRGDHQTAWSGGAVASAILRRPFLAGESGPWVDQQRREIHEYEVRCYDTLAGAWLLYGNPVAAVHAARQAVDLAPYRESAYARLMEAHLAVGNRAEALQVYEEVRTLLRDSMGISPGTAVEALYEQAIG